MGLKKTPRFLLLTIGYAALIQAAFLASLLLRFEGQIPHAYWVGYLQLAPAFTVLSLIGFFLAGLYHGLWRYASTVTLFQVFRGVTMSALGLGLIGLVVPQLLFPRSLVVMVWVWELVLLGGARFAWRLSRERVLHPTPRRAIRTLVVGADHTGVHLIQEMRRSNEAERLTPVGFIDDDARLSGHRLEGVEVLGTIAHLPRAIQERRVEMVVVSDPDMPARVVREIASFCVEANVRVKTLPGLSDLQHGRTALSQMRDMRIEDFLGREPVKLDLNEVATFLQGERVLVTGAGGSIGSELARQIAGFGPAVLVLLDHAENGLYYVHHELIAQHPRLSIHPVVADIKDGEGVARAFERFRPTVVFHAAAHKHVPLLELNPREAVLNNIVGTRNLVDAADRHGVSKFVLISTDKAVNPTSVMGASKRVCEMLLQSRSQHSGTHFVTVRFGNVLGSNGSVIPLFQRQLQRGGPITVTHPETRRYFMTIPEAVRLVLQAGAMGKGGEVLLLDMGEQVRILDLARQLIRMAGLREGEDIKIVFTGLRPGEKLYEELHSDSERTRITRHQRILTWDLDARDEPSLRTEVAELEAVSRVGDPKTVKEHLTRLVPEYSEPRHDPLEVIPETPVVRLPAAAPQRVPAPEPKWTDRARRVVEGVAALCLLVLSLPLWLAAWLDALRGGVKPWLVGEVRVGKTRRRAQRRIVGEDIQIDRRSIERRTQDLLGRPIHCLRFARHASALSRALARHHLDRVPMLLNVLRGEMALVGPLPETEERVLRWKNALPEYERRFTVLPGLTGLAQLSGSDPNGESIARRVQYDLFYVDHRSLLLDLRTLSRTAALVLRPSLLSKQRNGDGAGYGRPYALGLIGSAPPGAVAAGSTSTVKSIARGARPSRGRPIATRRRLVRRDAGAW
jgi:FlaA1/EpsC-like NDP-sugar epimerase/lipopolysaccharide/colanic/teichoic acid biosynthesis glycosyltransferase